MRKESDTSAITSTPITFNASGGEYFRIWIVNLLLSIVTLGIYSAWAKVRRNQYFYSSTELAGGSFDYHGNPVAILKGRIAALLLFLLYSIAPQISIRASIVMVLVMAAALPWLIWRSLQFKLYNSSYRGIRFGFGGSARQAYTVFLLLPFLNLLTLGLLTPFVHQRLKQFQHTESRFGTSLFSFNGSVGGFYKAYAVLLGMILAGTVGMFLLGLVSALTSARASGNPAAAAGPIIIAMLVFYAWMLTVVPLFLTMIQNLIWNHTRLQQHQFKSNLQWGRSTVILLTNLLGVVFTLGLFTPFAQVRWLKYRLESVTLNVSGSLDAFVSDTEQQVGAAGEGMVDLLDFDLSI
ncbi:YjgN family protein [Janthinobacterium agaricidamnosum]|uniref:YjgN family protein n=1 Tax=Janthinobacterium agaricidamnosum TaxID=55508 RepID=UPI00056EA2EE|nr:YjgN family protein [Janthinobacterium agaricidamnosum]